MPILILILLFVLVIFGYAFYAYNRMTRLRNVCEAEWSHVDVNLKKRADLIPNLVEVVKGYARHEMDVLESVSRARTEAMQAEHHRGDEELDLSKHVKTVFALKESYPDLKANLDFLKLQGELFEVEDEIAEHRHNYNDVVKAYNDFVLKFPGNVVAAITGFYLMELFMFTGSREAPRLDLTP